MSTIRKLNFSFVDGTTLIDAEKMNSIVNTINQLVDAANNQTSSEGGNSSGTVIEPVVPTIELNTSTKRVSLSATSGLTIKYSVDGSTPTTIYTSDIDVSAGAVIKAVSTNGTSISSLPLIMVKFSNTASTIALESSAVGTIRYTDNGSDPTSSSTIYTSVITASSGKTLKCAVFSGNERISEIATIVIQ